MAGSHKRWTFRLRIHPLFVLLLLFALWAQVPANDQVQFCIDVVLLWLLLPGDESDEEDQTDD